MAKVLSWVAVFLAVMTVALFWLLGYEEPGSQSESVTALSLYAGFFAPIVALAGLLLAKRGGKPAPRLARVALAFGIGAFAWPLLLLGPYVLCLGACY